MHKILVRILVIFSLLFSIVPSQAETMSQFTVLTYPGTDIYVDGVYADHSYGNWIMIYVSYGTHKIKVTKSGYYDFVKTVNIDTKISSVFVDTLTPISVSAAAASQPSVYPLKAADDLIPGDLNGNGVSGDAGDLVLIKRASTGEIQADSRYDLNNKGQNADVGDLVLMKRASIGEIEL